MSFCKNPFTIPLLIFVLFLSISNIYAKNPSRKVVNPYLFSQDSLFLSNNEPMSIPFDAKLSRGFLSYHPGIDIVLHLGDSIKAAWSGKITTAKSTTGGYGNLIVINHPNGLETYYGHLSKLLVSEGDSISAGQVIGLGGTTGYSTGPHLHFETRYNGIPFNPEIAIAQSGSNYVFQYMNPKSKTAYIGGFRSIKGHKHFHGSRTRHNSSKHLKHIKHHVKNNFHRR